MIELNEQLTENYYDNKDHLYRSFWSKSGQLSWGKFEGTPDLDSMTQDEFEMACQHMAQSMAQSIPMNNRSTILDAGCGNGVTSLWLADTYGAQVIGIDLSQVRIENANKSLSQFKDLQDQVRFFKGSLIDIELPNHSVTHVFSQATFYHVHDKEKVFSEIARVLEPGGHLIFDDLIKPQKNISEEAQRYVYDRLLFDTDFNFLNYQQYLEESDWNVVKSEDLSRHLSYNYQYLAKRTEELAKNPTSSNQQQIFQELNTAYRAMVKAIENQELGWASYVCRKKEQP